MQPQNFAATHEVSRSDCVIDAHREIVPQAKRRELELHRLTDELHVQRQSGVAGIIKVAGLGFDDESSRIAAVAAIGQAARMDRGNQPPWVFSSLAKFEGGVALRLPPHSIPFRQKKRPLSGGEERGRGSQLAVKAYNRL